MFMYYSEFSVLWPILHLFLDYSLLITSVFCLMFIYYSLFSVLWPMLPVFLDYSLLINLCVLSNVYLLLSVQWIVVNVTFVPRLHIDDCPLGFFTFSY